MRSTVGEIYELFETDPAPMLEFLQWVREAYGIGDSPRVLDVGCGPGRLLAEFHCTGWEAEGLEPDPGFFERAKTRAEAWPGIVVRQGGFAEIEATGSFDMVVAMNGPFSYLVTAREREDAVRRAFGALRPAGVLVLDLANFPWILKNYREPLQDHRTSGDLTVTRVPAHSFDFHHCTWTHTDRFVVQRNGVEETLEMVHRMSMIGYPEVARVLEVGGFVDVRTFNGYGARKAEPLSGSRVLVTAARPSA